MAPSVIILDTGPLSNSVVASAKPNQNPTLSQQCRQWLTDCEMNGVTLIVPAIAYYESLRELERRKAVAQVARLQPFVFLVEDRFVPVTTAQLEHAARIWGAVRNSGRPTASSTSLDADVILAAQAISLGLPSSDYIIATTNPRHIAQFAPCDLWTNSTP